MTDPDPTYQAAFIEGSGELQDGRPERGTAGATVGETMAKGWGPAARAEGAAEADHYVDQSKSGPPYEPGGVVEAIGAAAEGPVGVASAEDDEQV